MAVLTALVSFGPLSTDLYLPSLPGLVRAFASDVPTVQLTLSAFLATFALGQLVYGPLSDRFGRRPVVLAGILMFTLGSLACVVAPSIEALIAARVAQAAGACAGPVLGRAVVRDLFERERAATVLATLASAMALAPMIGPVVGGVLEDWQGWRASFLLLAVIGAATGIAVLMLLPETNRNRDPRALDPGGLARTYVAIGRNWAFQRHALTCACAYGGLFGYISGSAPTLMTGFGMGPELYGICFGVVAGGYAIGAAVAARLTRRIGIDAMIRRGTASALVGGGVMTVVAWADPFGAATLGPWGLVLPMILVGAAAGLIMPNAMAAAVAPYPREAGRASALLGFQQMSFAALLGVLVAEAFDGATGRAMSTGILLVAALGAATFRLPAQNR
jgi:DHA1 family bicyclomycin/chloramphenicol resistance-like MFS transporter